MNLRRAMLRGRPALAFLEGPPSGPPLLFLHGLGRSSEDIEPLAMPLSGQWQVKALDFRGHGGSDRVPGGYHVADYVQDAVKFLEQREPGPGPVVLHGHSLGAMVALAVAAC